jgi:hypothetical protein
MLTTLANLGAGIARPRHPAGGTDMLSSPYSGLEHDCFKWKHFCFHLKRESPSLLTRRGGFTFPTKSPDDCVGNDPALVARYASTALKASDVGVSARSRTDAIIEDSRARRIADAPYDA